MGAGSSVRPVRTYRDLMGFREIADAAMEVTVIPSFTKLGYAARRRLFGWEDLATSRLDSEVVAITGASSGLGLAAARQLASMGAGVMLLVRNVEKGERAMAELTGEGHRVVACDLTDPASVREAAAEIGRTTDRLRALVHNAGFLTAEYGTTVAGRERTFATMVLGPHLLTRELLPILGAGSRVIWVASGGMYTQRLDVDDVEMGPDDYRGSIAYARAKRAQVVLTKEWAGRLRDRGIAVHAMHPGWADTPGIHEGLPTFAKLIGPLLRDTDEGADTIAWLVAADEPATVTGLFFHDRAPRPTEKLPGTATSDEEQARLWTLVEGLTA
jgi:dehydrogenase/reductase SDR family protein 12